MNETKKIWKFKSKNYNKNWLKSKKKYFLLNLYSMNFQKNITYRNSYFLIKKRTINFIVALSQLIFNFFSFIYFFFN